MAKSLLKLKSRELRKQGKSIKEIASFTGVSKSSVSLWCRDIELTSRQIERLIKRKENGLKLGQINAALKKKKLRDEKIEKYEQEAIKRLGEIKKRDLFLIGLALYLGEGFKYHNRAGFTNSDPLIIKFMINWFKSFFDVPVERFAFFIIINEVHSKRDGVVKKFWSDYLGVPTNQFRKTHFVKTRQKKTYENYNNYFGTLTFRILKGADIFYRIKGFLKGLISTNHHWPA